ncbi:MAG TPA: hypothetical protein VGE52_16805 [Pirellulales bacterium]
MSPMSSHASPSPCDDRPRASDANGSVELFWEAFRYVSGDESGPDGAADSAAARFEERLATDQAAREAVAQVVSLVAAIKSSAPLAAVAPAPSVAVSVSAEASVSSASSSSIRGALARLAPLVWMSVGAAAMWLLSVGVPTPSGVTVEAEPTIARSEVEYPAGLAAAVATFPAPAQTEDEARALPASDLFSDLAMLDAEAGDESGDESLTGVPSWMLQAVSESQRQAASRE